MVETALKRHQFEAGAPSDNFLALASATPDNNIQVLTAVFVKADGATLDDIPDTVVGTFPVFTGGGADVERWDLVTLDPSGPSYVISAGVDQPAGSFKTSVPVIPTDHIPVAAVRVDEAGTVIVVQSDIADVRGFYHPTDLNFAGGAATPLILDPINAGGTAGVSTSLSRQDHVHPHGDLAGTANTHHDTVQSVHTQATPANWTVADASAVQGHLDELADKILWVRKVSEFANLQAALADFYAATNDAGILVIDSDVSLSGSVVVSAEKPLRIVGSTANRTITLASGTLSFDASGVGSIAPVVWENLTFLRGVTETGHIEILDAGKFSFLDCTFVDSSTSATDAMFDWSVVGVVIIELIRCAVPIPSATTGFFDISDPGGSFKIFCRTFTADGAGTEKLFKRSGGGVFDLYMFEHSAVAISDWGAVPGTINIHYDGTSILTGDTTLDVLDDVTEINGEAFYGSDFAGIVALQNILEFGVATSLLIGNGTHTIDPVDINRTSSPGLRIRGQDRKTTLIASKSAVASGIFINTTAGVLGVVFEEITIRMTGSVGGTAVIIDLRAMSIRNANIVIFGDDCLVGLDAGSAEDVFCSAGGTGGKFTAAAVRTVGTATETLHNVFVEAFEADGFLVDKTKLTNCGADLRGGIAGVKGFRLRNGSSASNCTARFSAGPAIASSRGFVLEGDTGADEARGCRLSNCKADGTPGSAFLDVGIELFHDGSIVHGCLVVATAVNPAGHGILLDANAQFNVVNGNIVREIAGNGIDESASNDNNFVGNLAQGVAGTDFNALSNSTGNVGFAP